MKSEFLCESSHKHTELIEEVENNLLSHKNIEDVSALFRIIGDPTRLKILWIIKDHELCVCDICVLMDMSKSAVSHQLAVLRSANLVKYKKEGKSVFYMLSDEHVSQLINICLEHTKE